MDAQLVGLVSAIVIAYGLIAAAVAVRTPALGIAIWIAGYPLFVNLAVPTGLDQMPPVRLGTLLVFLAVLPRLPRPRTRLAVICLAAYGAFIVSGVLSAASSPLGVGALARTISYLEPLIWFFLGLVAINHPRPEARARTVLAGMTVGFVLVLLVAIPEFLSQTNPFIALGLSRNAGNYMVDRRLGFTGRLVSTLGQPVYAGLYGVVAVAVSAYLARHERSPRRRFVLWTITVAGCIFVFLTGTRAAVLGLALLPLGYWLISGGLPRMLKLAPAYLLVAVVGYFLIPRAVSNYWKESLVFGEVGEANANVLGRLALTKSMIDVFESRPILGIGPGFYQKFQGKELGADTEGMRGVENQYATLLAENGILGMGLAAGFFLSLLLILARAHVGVKVGTEILLSQWSASVVATLGLMAFSCFVLTTLPMFQALAVAGAASGHAFGPRVPQQ